MPLRADSTEVLMVRLMTVQMANDLIEFLKVSWFEEGVRKKQRLKQRDVIFLPYCVCDWFINLPRN